MPATKFHPLANAKKSKLATAVAVRANRQGVKPLAVIDYRQRHAVAVPS